jgi:putative DNA primase/helicase
LAGRAYAQEAAHHLRARGRRNQAAVHAYGRAALEREIAALAATATGGRNHVLNRAAFRLFQLVGGGELHHAEVIRRLIEACNHNGLINDDGARSVWATIRSAATAGLRLPRSRKGAAA